RHRRDGSSRSGRAGRHDLRLPEFRGGRYESADGETYIASIQINDRIPLGSAIMEVGTAAPPRIHLTNINGRAAIELNDSEGKTRIRLFVNPDGTSGIEMLDDEGKVVSNLLNPADK